MDVKRFHEEGVYPCWAGRNFSVKQSSAVCFVKAMSGWWLPAQPCAKYRAQQGGKRLPAAAHRVCEQRGVEEIREALSLLSTGPYLCQAAQP